MDGWMGKFAYRNAFAAILEDAEASVWFQSGERTANNFGALKSEAQKE